MNKQKTTLEILLILVIAIAITSGFYFSRNESYNNNVAYKFEKMVNTLTLKLPNMPESDSVILLNFSKNSNIKTHVYRTEIFYEFLEIIKDEDKKSLIKDINSITIGEAQSLIVLYKNKYI